MELTYTGNMFIVNCSYEQRHIPKQAGFFWSPPLKKWYTSSLSVARELEQYADESAKKQFNKYLIKVDTKVPASNWPEGLTPRDYQLDGVKWATTRSSCLLRHDPGTGKTIEAALCINAVPGKTLIVVPPFLKINWQRELTKWCTKAKSITLIESGTKIDSYDLRADIIIVPDSLIARPKVFNKLKTMYFTWIFVDEIHRFKSINAERTKSLFGYMRNHTRHFGLIENATRRVGLTGTPMPSRPMELYPLLSAMAPSVIDFMSRHDYGLKYCSGYFDGFGWDYSGASNQADLNRRLTKDFMHVIKKADVLKELPPKTYQKIYVDKSVLSKKVRDFEKEILEQYALEELATKALGQMSGHRRELGIAKVAYSTEFIKDILENSNEKILVYGWHTDVITELADNLKEYSPFVITGATSNTKRMQYVDEFQNNPDKRLFIGNIQAMGVGLTLTKATRAIFTEFSWVPADNEQAEDRIHRIGQTENCLIQYIIVEDSIDEDQLDSLMRKKQNILKIVG